MKTKYITLRQNDALKSFCYHYDKSIKDITDLVIGNLLKYNLLCDSPEEFGLNLRTVIEEGHIPVDAFLIACFGVKGKTHENYINEFEIWGMGECPDCGGELEPADGLMSSSWEECKNCGYERLIGPKYDPDEYRDDWDKARLLNDITLN